MYFWFCWQFESSIYPVSLVWHLTDTPHNGPKQTHRISTDLTLAPFGLFSFHHASPPIPIDFHLFFYLLSNQKPDWIGVKTALPCLFHAVLSNVQIEDTITSRKNKKSESEQNNKSRWKFTWNLIASKFPEPELNNKTCETSGDTTHFG